MKTLLRKISFALVAAIAVIGLGVFAAACNDDKNDASTYTIKVVYEDGTAVDGTASNMTVQICTAQLTGELITCYSTFNVGADGTASVTDNDYPDLKNNTKYHWQVNNLPEGYTYDEDATFLTEPGNLTITLTPEQ